MKTLARERNWSEARRGQGGQTLIIALILLGVLLVLGFVFLAVIKQNITSSVVSHRRSLAGDLAAAGVRYAHAELVNSEQGADWQVPLTPLEPGNFTRDPDALYLRPGSGLGLRSAGDPQIDLGGPDGLGFYTRLNYDGGRVLVRVRYAPSDANIFNTSPTGPLIHPGRARDYLIIEAVGRPGVIKPNDPTTLNVQPVQYQGYAGWAQFNAAYLQMKTLDARQVSSKKVIAFASIGVIESARYITDKYRETRAAELGVPSELGVMYNGVVPNPPLQLGSLQQVFDLGNPPVLDPNPQPLGGSIYCNADLQVYGEINSFLNYTLGDEIDVAGDVIGNDNASALTVNRAAFSTLLNAWQTTTTTVTNGSNPSLASRNPNFSTLGGVFRDGMVAQDLQGYSRAASYKAPPTIESVDPVTGENRYVEGTRESGFVSVTGGNSGYYGQGSGVFVNNSHDVQVPEDEDGRMDAGAAASLEYDWLNPNNGRAGSGWQGSYYVPPAACVQLLSDGFIIRRDANAPKVPVDELFWKDPYGQRPHDKAGNVVDSTVCRFRLGFGGDGKLHIINSFTPDPGNPGHAVDVDALNPNFDAGPDFNGLLYFQGNARVRGVIPTNVQLTLVSKGSIYIDGSITKGIAVNGVRINGPTSSSLMLMAKQYVALNTTEFVGPSSSQELQPVDDEPSPTGFRSVRMTAPSGTLDMSAELLLDPASGNPLNPQTWNSYAMQYVDPLTATAIPTTLLLTDSCDDGPSPATFISLDINDPLSTPLYQFALDNQDPTGYYFNTAYFNTALQYLPPTPPGSYGPVYGLGGQAWQRFSMFESQVYPLVTPANMVAPLNSELLNGGPGNKFGQYSLLLQDTNDLLIRPNLSLLGSAQNNYLLARSALVPGDVRIEASMYAEEGSFFVIAGPWFNPNPNDNRVAFNNDVTNYENGGLSAANALAAAQQDRLENFGSYPQMPFYEEPLDERIVIDGAVSENMPPPISEQAEWLKKWGWIPTTIGSSGVSIPRSHFPPGYVPGVAQFVPNLIYSYDPVLATGRPAGFVDSPGNPPLRTDSMGRMLPPMPRLPVSPTLAYFGEVSP